MAGHKAPVVSGRATAGFGLFEGWPEECFHHPPKHDAPAFRELKQVNRPAAVLIRTLELGRSQTDYSRCWTNTRISTSVQSSVAGGGPSLREAAAPSRRASREGAARVVEGDE